MEQRDFLNTLTLIVGLILGAWLAVIPGSAKANTYTISIGSLPLNVSDKTCSSYRSAATAYVQSNGYPTLTANTCSTDPLVIGTIITFSNGGTWIIQSISAQCSTGYIWNQGTLNCDLLPSVVCAPSFKTVSPCPSGYAPKEITVQSSTEPDPYTSPFDSLPVQDVLYAIGVALCGLMGVAVGVRLT